MLASGTRLGPYEIVAALGAGGMGEVYRARDTRLGREVAIKVLPQHLSANPEVRARFEREAKTISGLNHPNICTLFDVGIEGDTDYLVMELIEGETLAQRLKKGPLGTPELLRLGSQIADALDRAHRAGVIHRDLKPANVMLTRSGAKLMDFGLARATGMAGGAGGSGATMAALTQSPTMAQDLTAEGTLIGTFQYMAPEQLEGKDADARSDIWALGCVLYEMMTGKRAFEGRSQASLIAAILEREPADLGEVPSGTPARSAAPQGLDRLIRGCLAKDPDERLQTAHDVKLQLQWIAEGAGLSSAGTPAPAVVRAAPQGARLAWGVAIAALVAAAAVAAWLYPRASARPPAYRFQFGNGASELLDVSWPRVSPDGRTIVYDARDSSQTVRAWVRRMDQVGAQPIPGSEGLQRPYWSPDNREIAFIAHGKMLRVPVTGGTPVVVCDASGGADLSWGSRGLILMDGQFTDSLRSVRAGGGELRPASRIDRAAGEVGSAWPCFLPDGEHFLFIGNRNRSTATGTMRLGRIGSLDSKLLGESDGRAEYAPGGWVLYLRGATLLARKLNLGQGTLTGEPITIAEGIRVGSSNGHFSISNTGVLAYALDDFVGAVSLHAVGRNGLITGSPLTSGAISNPTPSPDGHRLLFERTNQQSERAKEIWMRDLDRGTEAKLSLPSGAASTPVWSPDGRRFACVLQPAVGPARIVIGPVDGYGTLDSIKVAPPLPSLWQWSAVGSRLVCSTTDFSKVFAIAADSASRTPRTYGLSARVVGQSVMSPDGRWMAYVSGEFGAPQVFVESLAGVPGRWQVSTTVGFFPLWTRNGRELVFEDFGSHVLAVEIATDGAFRAGTPQQLFTLPLRSPGASERSWSCTADGEHFFLLVPPRSKSTGTFEVVTDFGALVSRR